jgi:threonine dehydrogenase-like Zn-dependent dehydrogenase
MKAIVFHGIKDIRLEDVPEPRIQDPNDAIVRLTASAICGTDLHLIRGSMPGMKKGTILGHEGVGIVEEVGKHVRNFVPGDRVVLCSTIACGYCSYCRAGYFAQCDNANPLGKAAGTAFFGGPIMCGAFDGMQAEKVRVPFANVGLVKIPDEVQDDQAILVSDIFPTGYFAAELTEIKNGDTVAVFGCGPVGLFSILSAKLKNAGRIFAIDGIESRLEKARELGAEIINFNQEHPVKILMDLTAGIGVDRVIDAVGIDAECPKHGPAAKISQKVENVKQSLFPSEESFEKESWKPGDSPAQVLEWMTAAVCKAGTIGIVGVYPQTFQTFPIGIAMNKNLALNMGNCHHRKYIPHLLHLVATGEVHPETVLSHKQELVDALDAYRNFDLREPGWTKVELTLQAA